MTLFPRRINKIHAKQRDIKQTLKLFGKMRLLLLVGMLVSPVLVTNSKDLKL